MSAIVKLSKLATQFSSRNPAAGYIIARNHWNHDYKPGPFPKTKEERDKAARKYGLHPSEYEPYPDDGVGAGDYPNLPYVGVEAKDPYYPYDFPEMKRNLNEPIHQDISVLGEDRLNPTKRHQIPLRNQYIIFISLMAGLYALYELCERFKHVHPRKIKQYPGEGIVHYTFEPAD